MPGGIRLCGNKVLLLGINYSNELIAACLSIGKSVLHLGQ